MNVVLKKMRFVLKQVILATIMNTARAVLKCGEELTATLPFMDAGMSSILCVL